MSIHDREYMQDEEQQRGEGKGRRPGHADRMLDQLDLSNLPATPPKSAFRRAFGWIRRFLGLGRGPGRA